MLHFDRYTEMFFLPHLPPADYAMTSLLLLLLLQQLNEVEGSLFDKLDMTP